MMQGAVKDDKGWRRLADMGRLLCDLYAVAVSFISNLNAGFPYIMRMMSILVPRTMAVKVRALGIALLLLCVFALHHLHVVRHGIPLHDPTPTELLFSLVAVLTGIAGFAMALVGRAMIQHYEWPPRDRG